VDDIEEGIAEATTTMPTLTDASEDAESGEGTWLSDVRLEFAKIVEPCGVARTPDDRAGSPVITRGVAGFA